MPENNEEAHIPEEFEDEPDELGNTVLDVLTDPENKYQFRVGFDDIRPEDVKNFPIDDVSIILAGKAQPLQAVIDRLS